LRFNTWRKIKLNTLANNSELVIENVSVNLFIESKTMLQKKYYANCDFFYL